MSAPYRCFAHGDRVIATGYRGREYARRAVEDRGQRVTIGREDERQPLTAGRLKDDVRPRGGAVPEG